MWCCLFGTSGTLPKGVVLPIWYFWYCTRRCGVAYLVLLGLYQKMLFCLFCTSETLPEDVVLPIWYFGDCTIYYTILYHSFLQFTKSINLIPLEVVLIVQIKGKIKQSL